MKKFLFLITVAALLWACGKKDTKPARPRDYIKNMEGVYYLKGTYHVRYGGPGPDSEANGEVIDTATFSITNDTELVMRDNVSGIMYFKYMAGNVDSAERIYFRGNDRNNFNNYSNNSYLYYYYKNDSMVDTNIFSSVFYSRVIYMHSM